MKQRLLLFMLLSAGIFACSPKYTASFGPSRKFYDNKVSGSVVTRNNTLDRPLIAEGIVEEALPPRNLEASVKVKPAAESNKIDHIVSKYTENKIPSTKEILRMPLKEKRQVFKEIKRDLKSIKKAKESQSIDNKKIYAGIIIALAGLVIAILASGPIGALGIIVGVALIAWGLIEDGGI